ncbi:hypothetical protein H8L32_25360 [Undibacterium sp. CY18W]|uniref:Uncharacterized protein n=1 Tax=Undibacterium hunanense TaxID=2762292 RepID=A0ABR6ZYT9_9BURK|nr:hypothetical protein [Undibacterium hunanense]MBC3920819.1 hypothetical protein [Undibacterium hunanense]
MGIISFLGFLACLLVFILLGSLCARYVIRFANIQSINNRKITLVIVNLVVIAAVWGIFNYPQIVRQQKMNAISADCGWKVYRTVKDVDGVFIASQAGEEAGADSSFFLEIYPQVEYAAANGEIQRLSRDRKPAETAIRRTFKYGFRTKSEILENGIERTRKTLLDFDKPDILAENVQYQFVDSQNPDLKSSLLFFVSYHPEGCGWVDATEAERRYRSVLQPK